jgi:hypothetical protein
MRGLLLSGRGVSNLGDLVRVNGFLSCETLGVFCFGVRGRQRVLSNVGCFWAFYG